MSIVSQYLNCLIDSQLRLGDQKIMFKLLKLLNRPGDLFSPAAMFSLIECYAMYDNAEHGCEGDKVI